MQPAIAGGCVTSVGDALSTLPGMTGDSFSVPTHYRIVTGGSGLWRVKARIVRT